MTEIPLDLSKLSREELETIFSSEKMPLKTREEADMLFELSDPQGMYVPGNNLSDEWTINVSPDVYSNVINLLEN